MDNQILDKLQLKLEVKGIHSIPVEWKQQDEQNPSTFQYQVRLQSCVLEKGKYQAKQLSENEIREQEELLNKNKNIKKDPKKDNMQQTIDNHQSEEELQRIEREKQELEEFNKLDELTQFYMIQENKFKQPQVFFDEKESIILMQDKELVIFEERVQKDEGEWIYLIKEPSISKDEIEKIKKSKPKGVNLLDLQPIFMRGWVDYSLLKQGQKQLILRVKLHQTFPGFNNPNDPQISSDIPRPTVDRLYIHLQINIDQSFKALEKPRPIYDYLLKMQPEKTDPKDIAVVKELIKELEIIYQSIAIEYSNQFGKDLNLLQEQLNKQLSKPKPTEAIKRRELFLYNFNISGKYKVLKDRVKKNIVRICKDKFNKTGSITGVKAEEEDTSNQDQFYSQIFTFLMQQMRQSLDGVISQQKQVLHEDVLSIHQQTEIERDTFLEEYSHKEKFQSIQKLAEECEILNDVKNTEKHLKSIINLRKKDPQKHYELCKFYCKQKKYSRAQECIMESLKYDSNNNQYLLMNALLLMLRNKSKESLLFFNHLQNIYDSVNDNSNLNLIYSLLFFLYHHEIKNINLANKYCQLMERTYQRKLNLLQPVSLFKENIIQTEIPVFHYLNEVSSDNKIHSLTDQQRNQMYCDIIMQIYDLNLIHICQQFIEFVKEPNIQIKIIQSQILAQNFEIDKSIILLEDLLKSNSNDVHLLKKIGDLYFELKQYQKCYDIYIKLLRQRQSDQKQKFEIFIKLGSIKLEEKLYGQAVIFYTKAAELDSESPNAFKGLGQSYLGFGDLKQAEDALNHANLLDIFDGQTWFSLLKLCIQKKDFIRSNQVSREFLKIKMPKYDMIMEIIDLYIKNKQNVLCFEFLQKYLSVDRYLNFDQIVNIYKKLKVLTNNKQQIEQIISQLDILISNQNKNYDDDQNINLLNNIKEEFRNKYIEVS